MGTLKRITVLLGLLFMSMPANAAVIKWRTYYVSMGCSSKVSWYGPGFHGNSTANGETFNQYDMTAASPGMPFNTRLRVTNKANGKSVVVRINDRGPFVGNRSLDLSLGAAREIDMLRDGVANVCIDKEIKEQYLAESVQASVHEYK